MKVKAFISYRSETVKHRFECRKWIGVCWILRKYFFWSSWYCFFDLSGDLVFYGVGMVGYEGRATIQSRQSFVSLGVKSHMVWNFLFFRSSYPRIGGLSTFDGISSFISWNSTFISCHPDSTKLRFISCEVSYLSILFLNHSLPLPPFTPGINALSTLDRCLTFISCHLGSTNQYLRYELS